jgi:hypothetical protein
MKNLGLAGAIALCGIGLILIGLGNFRTQTLYAAPAVASAAAVQDTGEPTIVWYGSLPAPSSTAGFYYHVVLRAWSDGTIEAKQVTSSTNCSFDYCNNWVVLSSPTDGLNAAADITFDEVVDGQDLATLLASWGEAPRNPMPPTECLLSDLSS